MANEVRFTDFFRWMDVRTTEYQSEINIRFFMIITMGIGAQ